MDNFLFIGYRFDIKDRKIAKDIWDFCESLTESGINIDTLPGSEWMVWNNFGNRTSILYMGGNALADAPSDYTCPIDREYLYSWAHEDSEIKDADLPRKMDLPDNHDECIKRLMNSDLYEELAKRFNKEKITLRWGIYMGLG